MSDQASSAKAKRIKVCYVHHSGVWGGASTSLYTLLRNLDHEKYTTTVITPTGSVVDRFSRVTDKVVEVSTDAMPGVIPSLAGDRLVPLKTFIRSIVSGRVWNRVWTHIANIDPDLVHLNEVSLLPLAYMCHLAKIPCVLHARCRPKGSGTLLDKIAQHFINRWNVSVICISESVSLGYTHVLRQRTIRNPLQFNSVESVDAYRMKTTPFRVLFLSNFIRYKGIEEVIDAAVSLSGETDIQFLFAGRNPRDHRFYRSRLGRLLHRLKLYVNYERRLSDLASSSTITNITYLGQVDDIAGLLDSVHVLLAPMHLDAPPRSIFEAAARGVPSILSLDSAVRDATIHNESGLVIPPKRPDVLAAAILRLKESRDTVITLGNNALNTLTNMHDPHNTTRRVELLYTEILQET